MSGSKEKDGKMGDVLVSVATARAAIIASGAHPSTSGMLVCPVCKTGNLKWTMASNGHIWAKCNTPNCVAWVE